MRTCAQLLLSRASALLPNSPPPFCTLLPLHTKNSRDRDKYAALRDAGAIKPFHARRAPHRVRMFKLGGCVVKEYSGGGAASRQKVGDELRALSAAGSHPGLVPCLFSADEGARISLVMPFAGTPLRDYRAALEARRGGGGNGGGTGGTGGGAAASEDAARHLAHQLAAALAHLHARGAVHRDVKPDNLGVLLPEERLRLFDWGEALDLSEARRWPDRELARRAGVAGTPLFMAPESLECLLRSGAGGGGGHGFGGGGGFGGGHDGGGGGTPTGGTPTNGGAAAQLRAALSPALDVWGLGAVVYFLLAGRDIFVADSEWELEELLEVAGRSGGVELPEGTAASHAARDFLSRCLERAPARRATAAALLRHPWLRGAETRAELEAALAADAAAAAAAERRRAAAAAARAATPGRSSGGGHARGAARAERRQAAPPPPQIGTPPRPAAAQPRDSSPRTPLSPPPPPLAVQGAGPETSGGATEPHHPPPAPAGRGSSAAPSPLAAAANAAAEAASSPSAAAAASSPPPPLLVLL